MISVVKYYNTKITYICFCPGLFHFLFSPLFPTLRFPKPKHLTIIKIFNRYCQLIWNFPQKLIDMVWIRPHIRHEERARTRSFFSCVLYVTPTISNVFCWTRNAKSDVFPPGDEFGMVDEAQSEILIANRST
jgi:hypothetical protein